MKLKESQIITFLKLLKILEEKYNIVEYNLKYKKFKESSIKFPKYEIIIIGRKKIEGYEIINLIDELKNTNSFFYNQSCIFTGGVYDLNEKCFTLKGDIYFN